LLGATAGCAGFAEVLMKALNEPVHDAAAIQDAVAQKPAQEPDSLINGSRSEKPARVQTRPVLLISGSINPVSIRQIKAALDSGIPGFAVPGKNLCNPDWFTGAEADNIAGQCAEALRIQKICIMGTSLSMDTATMEVPADTVSIDTIPIEKDSAGNPDGALPENISGMLGKLIPAILQKTGPVHLAIFGGDTLLGIMEYLEYGHLIPLAEIKPGIVLSKAVGESREVFVVTKSGAFGDDSIIESIRVYFEQGAISTLPGFPCT
jgi:uncharacterized protein YgbK (DUF1537 family)